MQYLVDKAFIKEAGGTCFHEFCRGRWKYEEGKPGFWKEDSVYLSDETMHDLKLKSLFKEALEAYDYYGNTFVDKDSWKVIVSLAKEKGGEALAVVEELASWVEANFEENEEFTIIGM